MKVEHTATGLAVFHRKGKIYYNGPVTDKLIKSLEEKLYKKHGGKPIKFKKWLPKLNIGKEIPKHWDKDFKQWTKGFSIFGFNFLTHYAFQKPNKYRITRKKPNPYKPYNVSVKWEDGEFEEFLKSIRQ